jgi:hypothetical protein
MPVDGRGAYLRSLVAAALICVLYNLSGTMCGSDLKLGSA